MTDPMGADNKSVLWLKYVRNFVFNFSVRVYA